MHFRPSDDKICPNSELHFLVLWSLLPANQIVNRYLTSIVGENISERSKMSDFSTRSSTSSNQKLRIKNSNTSSYHILLVVKSFKFPVSLEQSNESARYGNPLYKWIRRIMGRMSGKEQFYWETIANKIGSTINVDQFARVWNRRRLNSLGFGWFRWYRLVDG